MVECWDSYKWNPWSTDITCACRCEGRRRATREENRETRNEFLDGFLHSVHT